MKTRLERSIKRERVALVTTSVALGSAAKRAATKNGRAEEATPTVASCPESSFAQASSSAPDLASDADSISINMSVPFGKCRPYRQQTKGRGPGSTTSVKMADVKASFGSTCWHIASRGLGAIGPAAGHHNLDKPESKDFGRFSLVYSNIRMR